MTDRVDRFRRDAAFKRVLLVRVPLELRGPMPRDDEHHQLEQAQPELGIAAQALVEFVRVVQDFGDA